MIVRALAMFALKCHLPESDVQKVLEIIPPQNKPPGKLSSSWDQTMIKLHMKCGHRYRGNAFLSAK